MRTQAPTPTQQTSRVDLVSLVERDLAEVASFIATQSGRSRESVEAHLGWFLLENPARLNDLPLGFGLRSGDPLVGCILLSPQAFCFGSNKILFMGSSCFYVDEAYRGHGGRIFLQYSRLGTQWPLFGTSANVQAATLWKAVGAYPIPGSDAELFGILKLAPVAEEFVHRRYSAQWFSRLAGRSFLNAAGICGRLKIDDRQSESMRLLNSAEQVNDLPIHHPPAKLTASRDPAYIRWRYYSGRDATTQAFAFRSRRLGYDVLVTVNRRVRGYRGQIITLNVLDVYPEVAAEEWLQIVGALAARYRNLVDAIVLRSIDPDRRKIFSHAGFRIRLFDAPNGWFLDTGRLLPTRDWYAVPSDGDGLI